MSKMGSHDPFGHLKHKLWPKEGPGTLKVDNRPNFLAWRWHATYCWKALDKGYKFDVDFISIRGLNTRLWTFKVAEVPILGISGLPLGSPSPMTK